MNIEEAKRFFIVVMGVSGTGKSTLGSALAAALRIPYIEGDDLHPRSNVEKMASGRPLTDKDREPWLALIRQTAEEVTGSRSSVVISCSALKKSYRDILRGTKAASPSPIEHGDQPAVIPPTYFVFIQGNRELLWERMEKRPGHFMKASMLDSQLATLESPVGERGVVVISLEDSTDEQVAKAVQGLDNLFNQ